MKYLSVLFASTLFLGAFAASCIAPLTAYGQSGEVELSKSLHRSSFGKTAQGHDVELYTMTNSHGLTVKVMTYGATVVEIDAPDHAGKVQDIALGFDKLALYEQKSPYFGATVGRYANRIAGAKFSLGRSEYRLVANDGANTLHGGKVGFDKVIWHAEPLLASDEPAIKFTYDSLNGEEGFPGNLQTSVTYSLSEDNKLKIEYSAVTDRPTPVNLTNHTYFNLSGVDSGISILQHQLTLNADFYTPVTKALLPTGKVVSVKNTPFDFTTAALMGARIDAVDGGYDHNFVVRRRNNDLVEAAFVEDARSGRTLKVFTTEPGLQFYSGNFLDGTVHGMGGVYLKHAGFTLEAQHYPDSLHHDNFPDTILRPESVYKQITVYQFGVKSAKLEPSTH